MSIHPNFKFVRNFELSEWCQFCETPFESGNHESCHMEQYVDTCCDQKCNEEHNDCVLSFQPEVGDYANPMDYADAIWLAIEAHLDIPGRVVR